jgi:DNA-binding MarR family transcriptional regulator
MNSGVGERRTVTAREKPDMAARPFELKTSPGHLLRRAQQFAADVYQSEVGADGLTPRQFAVLYTVEAREGLSQTDLVRETGIDRSTLADMIGRMLKKDLLARKRTEGDQRANAVKITAAGRKALKAALPAVARAEAKILDVIPASKRNELLKILTIIADKVDALEHGGGDEPQKPPRKRR